MNGTATAKLALRPFLPADTPILAEIFRSSIEELTEDDYNPAQQEAWASSADDLEAFTERLGKHLALVATVNGSPVGFISLDTASEIGLFYVHPAMAGQGVGRMLYEAVEKLSTARGTAQLTVEASDTAVEFFQRRGFVATQRNSVSIGNEWLSNTTMTKKLAKSEAVETKQ